ncbi:Putative fatty acyl-CoA reductase CG5065 [Eumeta japonica]|uniref:Fatty acyl-CoA reductase n=1 Tax=Eumeta variegata TaxID=151549 RepID=A0A4C1XTM4_EUMVA|nr:Putative fatty acyl-CoA reductase CG5065 [Eumeta japonica]
MDRVLGLEVAALAQSRSLQKIQESGDSQIQKYFADKTILVTGGTGFLGKQLTEKLLRSCREIRRIYLLIRPKKGKDVSQRIQDQFSETLYDELRKCFPSFATKIVGVEGDTSEIGLALSEKNKKMLTNELDVIVHVAATVRFDDPIKKAVLTNTRGTRELYYSVMVSPRPVSLRVASRGRAGDGACNSVNRELRFDNEMTKL